MSFGSDIGKLEIEQDGSHLRRAIAPHSMCGIAAPSLYELAGTRPEPLQFGGQRAKYHGVRPSWR